MPEDAKVFTGSFDYASDETTPETVWYAVVEDTTVDNRLAVLRNKTVNLVIKDGATLTCNQGIRVARLDGDDPDGTYRGTLNVYGTTETGGALFTSPARRS